MMATMPVNHAGEGVILLTFDDGRESVYDNAFPIMADAGLVGTVYVSPETTLVTPMTVPQMQEMYAAGWDMANHTLEHTYLQGTQAAQEAMLADCRDLLIANEMPRAALHVAYPWGVTDANTAAAMTATGMLTGRSVTDGYETSPPGNVKALTIKSREPGVLSVMTCWLDYIKANNACAIVLIHDVLDDGGSSSCPIGVFRSFVDYIARIGIRAQTITEWYANLSEPLTYPDFTYARCGTGHGNGYYVPTNYAGTWVKGPYLYLK
jgi:peptidoglycan/xylan/chitin deacetylase (PgdA/CDA1 family)